MKFLITGGGGYLGGHLAKFLVEQGHQVTIFDYKYLRNALRLKSIRKKIIYKSIDLKNFKELKRELKNFDVVAHFAASADIALGKTKTDVDLKEGTLATYNVLECMRQNNIKKIIYSSSSAIYGNSSIIPTPENAGPLLPISLYGASKISGEALVSAYCYLFGMKSWIFRFVSVVGRDMERGVIKDFIKKLRKNPNKLKILGDGHQKKDFIYIEDWLNAILFVFENVDEQVNVFNIGSGTTILVNKIAKMVTNLMKLKNVQYSYSGGKSGWPGDAPVVHYDITKIKNLGWHPKFSSDEAIKLAIIDMLEQELP